MQFAGIKNKITFNLVGNFHRDICRARIRFTDDVMVNERDAEKYVEGFARHQTGNVSDIMVGSPPADYLSGYPWVILKLG